MTWPTIPRLRTTTDVRRARAGSTAKSKAWTLADRPTTCLRRWSAPDVPASKIYTSRDIAADAHYAARQMIRDVADSGRPRSRSRCRPQAVRHAGPDRRRRARARPAHRGSPARAGLRRCAHRRVAEATRDLQSCIARSARCTMQNAQMHDARALFGLVPRKAFERYTCERVSPGSCSAGTAAGRAINHRHETNASSADTAIAVVIGRDVWS